MTTSRWTLVLALLLGSAAPLRAQDPTPVDTVYAPGEFRVFTGAGARATLDDVIGAMAAAQVVFIGETHDDPTAHMLQLELLQRATLAYGRTTAARRPVALSLEFFERDAQLPLDEYLAGLITESSFRTDARPWPRYATDYRP